MRWWGWRSLPDGGLGSWGGFMVGSAWTAVGSTLGS